MKRVLITAGGNGIGRAMGQGFDDAGFQVWVTDVDATALADCPANWKTSNVDASDEGQMSALFAQIDSDWGGWTRFARMQGSRDPLRA